MTDHLSAVEKALERAIDFAERGYISEPIRYMHNIRDHLPALKAEMEGMRKALKADPSTHFQNVEERLCECGASGTLEDHAPWCPWLKSEWFGWGEAVSYQGSLASAPSPAATESGETQAARDVLAERRRQVEVEGWTPEHDDEHDAGEMAVAAGLYALNASTSGLLEFDDSFGPDEQYPIGWPWHRQWWKPKNRRRDLVRAGALILAEIERVDRAASPPPTTLPGAVRVVLRNGQKVWESMLLLQRHWHRPCAQARCGGGRGCYTSYRMAPFANAVQQNDI